ncbi:MAG: DUF6285 domain-containing protein [Bosea sp. (in: a-proteobacteria)]|jgi:hypothetical protein
MTPETTGLDLLHTVEQTLVNEVGPLLAEGASSSEARFKVLMAASAIRMVMREWRVRDELAALSARADGHGVLVAAIRAGEHDADPALHAALLADAELRTSISRPGAV